MTPEQQTQFPQGQFEKTEARGWARAAKGLKGVLTASVIEEQLLFCNPRWSDRLLQNYITS